MLEKGRASHRFIERQPSNRDRDTPEKVYSNTGFQMLDGDRDATGTDLQAMPRSPTMRQSDAGSRLTPVTSMGRRGRMASLAGERKDLTLEEDAPVVISVQPKNRINFGDSTARTPVQAFEPEPASSRQIRSSQQGLMIRDDGQADPRSAPHSPTGQSRSLTRSTENWEADFRSTIKSSPSKAVKMQGPPGAMVKCYVKRVKDFFGSFPTFLMFLDNGSSSTFMLAARRRKKTRHSAYVMSIDQDDLKRDTEKCIAKLKANDAGNEYTLYQRQDDWRYDPEVCVSFGSTGSDYAAPRNILVALPSPSALMPGAEKPLEPSSILDMVRSNDLPSNLHRKVTVLCNKMPEFDTSLQMFALDFKGRVKVPSVKNFQMTMWDPSDPDQSQKTKGGEVILQFGKMRDEIYSLDFAWPLTPQTAFAIALSSFDKRVR